MRAWTVALLLTAFACPASAESLDLTLERIFADVDPSFAPSGVLYDRVLPLSGIEALDGSEASPAVSSARWRQVLHELRNAGASVAEPSTGRSNAVDLAVLDFAYDRIREDAVERGLAGMEGGRLQLDREALAASRVFTAAALRDVAWRSRVEFRIGDWSGDRAAPSSIEFDPGDGGGPRSLATGGTVIARYESTGSKVLRLTATWPDGETLHAAARFQVLALANPAPDDTLQVVASRSFQGTASSGEAYLYYANGRSTLERPVVLVEGFDLDDSMNWDEVYALLNAENLIEDVRAAGFDIVVLNFDDATTEIQRNGLLVVELLEQVQSMIDPATHYSLAGASMGGLCSRYALAWMERNGVAHRVHTFISFDAPHRGASIPLGLQYWLDFFSGQSADAQFLLSRLDRPAARQLLVYHHTTPPAAVPGPDPLRGAFLDDLAALGNYPAQPRLVAIANGSGALQDQGYLPGARLITWEYDSWLLDIRGNVSAVGDQTSQLIFEGRIIPFLLPSSSQDVVVSGTRPYDNGPGGSRSSLAQADSTEAPYGDILAQHPDHCFIPTISALDLATDVVFFDVAGEPDPASMSPFDAVYFPQENQPHVAITAENAAWFKAELFGSPTAAPPAIANPARFVAIVPNPFNPRTTIQLEILEPGHARLEVFDLRGRRVAALLDEDVEEGTLAVMWDGTDASGAPVASGVYVARLVRADHVTARRMALVR